MQPPKFNHPRTNLRKYYTIFLELGIIGSLLIFIVATNINMRPSEGIKISAVEEQEIVKMEDVIKTEQPERPPSPPVPTVPVAVPNSEIIEDEILEINAEIQFNEPLEIPEPPKSIEVKEEEEEDFFIAVEQMPELIGTLGELQKQIVYPELAKQAEIEGMVIVQFVINEEGNVVNPRVIRGIGGGCDEEAVRVTKLAKFEPGRQRGKAVRVQYSLPFRFILKK